MDCPTFHYFSYLPPELQYKIWGAAVRPMSPHVGGIHSFSIITTDRKLNRAALPWIRRNHRLPKHIYSEGYVSTVAMSERDGTANRSAYFWDAGLWTACWASRKVITACMDMGFWKQQRVIMEQQYSGSLQGLSPVGLPTLSWESQALLPIDFKVPSLPNNDRDRWRLVVHPNRDAFKLRADTILPAEPWITILNQLPFAAPEKGGGPVRNLVVDFDPSWNQDWPKDISGLELERSPRGMVGQITWALVTSQAYCVLWFIDRHTSMHQRRRRQPQPATQPALFYDCDEYYVEISIDRARMDNDPVILFMDRLNEIVESILGPARPGDERPRFSIYNHVGVLKPRRALQE